MLRRVLRPSGRFILGTAITAVLLMATANIVATVFWHAAGGVGELDLDGAANLFSPSTDVVLPASGTGERLRAIVQAYPPAVRTLHVWITCTLDVVFPLTVALLAFVALRGFALTLARGRGRALATAAGAALGGAYLIADLGENVLEVALLTGIDGVASAIPPLSQAKTGVFAVIAVAALAAGVALVVRRPAMRRRDRRVPH